MSAIDSTWLDERIDATKTLIVAYEAAILSLAGGAQSYTLDTGQTRQTVTRAELGSLRIQLGELENRLATLDARRCGATTHIIPGF